MSPSPLTLERAVDELTALLKSVYIASRPKAGKYSRRSEYWGGKHPYDNMYLWSRAKGWVEGVLPRDYSWVLLDNLARLRIEAEVIVFIRYVVERNKWSPNQMPEYADTTISPYLAWLHNGRNGSPPPINTAVEAEVERLAHQHGIQIGSAPQYVPPPGYSAHSLAHSTQRRTTAAESSLAAVPVAYHPIARWEA
ncbi:hypothetical protein JCM6882_003350 [Rhodosporidiobolus microsporus]